MNSSLQNYYSESTSLLFERRWSAPTCSLRSPRGLLCESHFLKRDCIPISIAKTEKFDNEVRKMVHGLVEVA
jgi:hypothetical protein